MSPRRPPLAAAAAALLAGFGAAGCASSLPPLPLRPEPIPFADTLPIPEPGEQPENRVVRSLMVLGPYALAQPLTGPGAEALDLTHFDDLVGSSWWVPRMGYRAITPAELARGPTSPEGAPHGEHLVVKSGKGTGVTPGFTAKDDKGDTYIVKFDPPGYLHLQSAPGVIGNRLMWGAGYHVAEDYLVRFDSADLKLADDASIETPTGERPMTEADLHALLQGVPTLPDGRFLALASKYVPGAPKGPFYFDGTRADDPNDHYDHEDRREVRALRVFSAWIDDVDMREGNTLDVYVKPGYLRHYLLDFGAALGSASTVPKRPPDGAEGAADLWRVAARLFTLGAYRAEWEDESGRVARPAIGYLEGAADFEPGGWTPNWTNPAFVDLTEADGYWASKILWSFTDAHIRAAVAAGGLPTEQLQDTLASLIEARRDVTVAYWFGKASTVEKPRVAEQLPSGLRLDFRDLGLEARLWSPGDTRYAWEVAAGGRELGEGSAPAAEGADPQSLEVRWKEAPASGDLLTVEITTRRPGVEPRPARVYLRREGGRWRVVGLMHGAGG